MTMKRAMYLERALHAQGDRTSRLLAEISAKLESVLRYFVEIWQELREQARPAAAWVTMHVPPRMLA
jgi:hypothetical protein